MYTLAVTFMLRKRNYNTFNGKTYSQEIILKMGHRQDIFGQLLFSISIPDIFIISTAFHHFTFVSLIMFVCKVEVLYLCLIKATLQGDM